MFTVAVVLSEAYCRCLCVNIKPHTNLGTIISPKCWTMEKVDIVWLGSLSVHLSLSIDSL